ncbi:Lrp/AsnC family transcriptional regulator [Novispirillum itersonii]|nr:Lrp/AsnC family transcriptional regulator [Novispirillum itersonii]
MSDAVTPPGTLPMTLDAVDRRIIRCLLEDATLSNNELAERVGLTAAPLSRRLARLYGAGVIRQAVVVDPAAVGLGLQAFAEVTLNRTAPEVGERFVRAIAAMPEVVECHTVTGDFDFLLKISVKDIADYKRLIWNEFDRLPDIKGLRSTIVFDTPKRSLGTLPDW